MIAKQGKKWILVSLLPIFLIYILIPTFFIGYIFILLPIGVLYFFRDPRRKPEDKGVVSPADGKVISIEKTDKLEISIFMRLHDVHVNRIPISGEITDMKHKDGKHFPAFLDVENEKLTTDIKTKKGIFEISQIAGLIARRITPYIKKGDKVKKGQKLGIIAFGSRVDMKFPRKYNKKHLNIEKGDKVKAGKTVIAKHQHKQKFDS